MRIVSEARLGAVLGALPGVPDRDGVLLESPFIGLGMRGRARLRYFPCRLSLVPVMLTRTLPPDIVLVQTSRSLDGTVSLGTEVNILPAAIETARARGGLVIAQVNKHVPYTYGDAVLSVDDVDYAIEADIPLPSPAPRPVLEMSAAIGDRVAVLVPDSDGVLGLAAAGALDTGQPVIASFAFGSQELYAWMDRNPGVRMMRPGPPVRRRP